ncbi:hypothetical protein [Nostoc phage NMeng1]|nr:hypothetical protein [Nostoc phage NMeng1]
MQWTLLDVVVLAFGLSPLILGFAALQYVSYRLKKDRK